MSTKPPVETSELKVESEKHGSVAETEGQNVNPQPSTVNAPVEAQSKWTLSRRTLLHGIFAAAVAPTIFIPKWAHAQTSGTGAVRHLIYIRLGGGFRFTSAFNGDVDGQFNPFGQGRRGGNTEWGATSLLEPAPFLDGEEGTARKALGMKAVSDITNDICVFPAIDHEPFSGRADGNHGTGLERFLTGYVGGTTSFLSYVNYGLRERVLAAAGEGKTVLPAFSLGESGMATGAGEYAAYRPPVLDGASFERFGFDAESALPKWAQKIAVNMDSRMRSRVHTAYQGPIESYQLTREATRNYNKIFNDPVLRVESRSTEMVDGISNQELETIFGTDTTARRASLALRLFHFGCPAVFMNQGGYDFHSGEDRMLGPEIGELNRLLSGLHAALHRMKHPEGGSYWDKTLVVIGSEFGRSTGGGRFNSAGGSDHGSDYATRWMSMPMMGGVIDSVGKGGRRIGQTRAEDLKSVGPVFSYRSMMKTMLDLLGCDHGPVFPADRPIQELFT